MKVSELEQLVGGLSKPSKMPGFSYGTPATACRVGAILRTANMVELLRRKYARKTGADRVFRWHDSGDLQSMAHLEAICTIAEALPDIDFWLPTKEYALIREFKATQAEPDNLAIRVSAPSVGQPAAPIPGTVSSTVDTGSGHTCPAPSQGNACEDCRACWDKSVPSVDYHRH